MKRSLVLLFALLGCEGAHREHAAAPDAGDVDAASGGEITCEPSQCGAMGCCGDHCCGVAPSNADVTGMLMPTGLVIAPPNGVFDTDAACTPLSALGHCEVVARPGLPEACVCRMDELVIDNVEITGTRALVIVAYKSVRVTTGLDVSGDQALPGPGAMPAFYTTKAGSYGGAGGSFATAGGAATGNLTLPAPTYGNPSLIPLHGGTSGQTGGHLAGGGGGGAVQITAGERIEVFGKILAGGGGGPSGVTAWPTAGGSGGGSGGAILLEAPTVTMTGTLNANGAGGGGADGSARFPTHGEDANDDLASGGEGGDGGGCTLHGYLYGGDGGNGATSTSPAGAGEGGANGNGCLNNPYIGGGGGGGGLGRIRINTTGGCQCNGTMSPSASFGTLVVQ
jgi:hypothetical protein